MLNQHLEKETKCLLVLTAFLNFVFEGLPVDDRNCKEFKGLRGIMGFARELLGTVRFVGKLTGNYRGISEELVRIC